MNRKVLHLSIIKKHSCDIKFHLVRTHRFINCTKNIFKHLFNVQHNLNQI